MAGILDGKVALITGAGSGIGRAAAQIFAREGAKLMLADIAEEGGLETLRVVKAAGVEGFVIRCDVSSPSDTVAMVAATIEHFGRLDCAFNNAGIEGEGGPTHECTEENWNRVLAVDLSGVWLCIKAEVAQMLRQGGRGAIVNTSSALGLVAMPGSPAYHAAKHGVVGVTKAAAIEYGRQGIRVNAVCPGPVRTPMVTRVIQDHPEMERLYLSGEPLERFGEPEEIGEAVAWLCSDRSSFVNGVALPVDGGWVAQ